MTVETRKWKRSASSGREDILSKMWFGKNPKAIIQIAHGMAEHVERYNDFAAYLVENGFVVCMNEHAGHGEHAETLGYFAETDGIDYVIADMKALQEEVVSEYPNLPVFLLGHSMGSFLSRKYITIYGKELAGCILSGTSGPNSAVGFAIILASIQKKLKGATSEGKFLNNLAFGSYLKKIENPVNAHAWLSRDDNICLEYKDDEYCGFLFTAGGFHDLFRLLKEINAKNWADHVPAELPIYIFSGEEDPVGEYGKGVKVVFERLRNSEHKELTLKLYKGGRHEMLNEINKDDVYEDVLAWLDKHID